MNEFKVGDWVTVSNGRPYQFKRFTKDSPEWNKSLDYENIEMLCGSRFHISNFDRSIIKLWQPKTGEWCWFWHKKDKAVFGKLVTIDESRERLKIGIYSIKKLGQNMNSQPTWYKFCEPFIGQLPSFIKDNK